MLWQILTCISSFFCCPHRALWNFNRVEIGFFPANADNENVWTSLSKVQKIDTSFHCQRELVRLPRYVICEMRQQHVMAFCRETMHHGKHMKFEREQLSAGIGENETNIGAPVGNVRLYAIGRWNADWHFAPKQRICHSVSTLSHTKSRHYCYGIALRCTHFGNQHLFLRDSSSILVNSLFC